MQAPVSTYQAIARWAELHPGKAAMIDRGVVYTYSDFHRFVQRMADVFENDLGDIRLAAVFMPDLSGSWIVTLALREIGADTIVPVNPRQILELDLHNLDCIVYHPAVVDEHSLRQLAASIRLYKITAGADSDFRFRDTPSIRSRPPGSHIMLSSGTTGKHKKIRVTPDTEFDTNETTARTLNFTADTVCNSLGFGLWTAICFRQNSRVWSQGGTVVFDDRPAHFFDHGVNRSTLIASELTKLIEFYAGREERPEPWRLNFSGGFLPADLAEQARTALNAEVEVLFGSTEISGWFLHSLVGPNSDLQSFDPYPDRTISIMDDSGSPCAAGAEGLLAVLLKPTDCQGYLDDDEATAQFFRDGYFYTGDLAVQLPDGRIRVLGRAADVINLKGQKLAARPFEERIRSATGAREVCMFSGLNHDGFDEVAVALEMQVTPGPAHLDSLLARLEGLGRVRFVVLPHFPRGQNGMAKVDRVALRKLVFDSPGSA